MDSDGSDDQPMRRATSQFDPTVGAAIQQGFARMTSEAKRLVRAMERSLVLPETSTGGGSFRSGVARGLGSSGLRTVADQKPLRAVTACGSPATVAVMSETPAAYHP